MKAQGRRHKAERAHFGLADTGMIRATPDGVVIAVRVIPRAAKSGVAGTRSDALFVRLHAPPVEGAANAELIRVIAATLDVPARAVSIVGGEHSRQKRVKVAGIDQARVEALLQRD